MIYRISDFTFNTKNRTLNNGKLTHFLTPQIYRLMLLFVESGGNVVSKNQIIDRVWCGQIVCESSLYKLIQKIRTLMDDDGHEQALIKNIHGEGYLMAFKSIKLGYWRQLWKKIA